VRSRFPGEADGSRTVCAAYTGPGKIYFNQGADGHGDGTGTVPRRLRGRNWSAEPKRRQWPGGAANCKPLTEESTLRLALLNIASLGAVSGLRVFDREAELATYKPRPRGTAGDGPLALPRQRPSPSPVAPRRT